MEERYIKYEDLNPDLQDIKSSVTKLFDDDWLANFDSLTELRSFLKFNWQEFQHYWTYLHPRLLQLCNSLRSAIAKNALLLLTELLSINHPELNPSEILTLLLTKSAVEKSFLKTEVVRGIENICKNYPSLENSQRLVQQSLSKSINVSKTALKYLDLIIEPLEPFEKFQVLLSLSEGKRKEHEMLARKIRVDLEIRWIGYHEAVSLLEEKDKKWVESLNSQKIKEKISIKEMIQAQKENIIG